MVAKQPGRELHASGRRNWIHIGSERAGPRGAAILSVVESCRRLIVPVRDYLGDILPGLGGRPTLPRTMKISGSIRATKGETGMAKVTPPPCCPADWLTR